MKTMITRCQPKTKAKIDAMASVRGVSLQDLFEEMLTRYLAEKPYEGTGWGWSRPGNAHESGWKKINVKGPESSMERLHDQVVGECTRIGVSMMMFLYSGIVWFLDDSVRNALTVEERH